MKCEIEFFAVGEGTRAGDAILIRYGEPDNYKLMVVDGGTTATGEAMVAHIKQHFGAQATIEHMVLTHSDGDHASGLREVLREFPVAHVWMHIPWLLGLKAKHLFKDKNISDDALMEKVKDEYDILSEIVDLGVEAGSAFYYPFEGSVVGPFTVLSPQEHAYLHLLPQFDKTPDADQQLIEAAQMWIGKESLMQKLWEKAVAKAEKWVEETWEKERLKDGGVTSASNESSVVLYGLFDRGPVILTGDAGVNALRWAANAADSAGFPLQNFAFVQIPHHGSRRNVGPTVLNRLLGPIQPKGTQRFTAFVSAPADDATHPRKMVLNAFMRRGGSVCATQGMNKVHMDGFPAKQGYTDATLLPFSNQVEEYD